MPSWAGQANEGGKYACPGCDKAYTWASSLTQHYKKFPSHAPSAVAPTQPPAQQLTTMPAVQAQNAGPRQPPVQQYATMHAAETQNVAQANDAAAHQQLVVPHQAPAQLATTQVQTATKVNDAVAAHQQQLLGPIPGFAVRAIQDLTSSNNMLVQAHAALVQSNEGLVQSNAGLVQVNAKLVAERENLVRAYALLQAKNAELLANNAELWANNTELQANNAELHANNVQLYGFWKVQAAADQEKVAVADEAAGDAPLAQELDEESKKNAGQGA